VLLSVILLVELLMMLWPDAGLTAVGTQIVGPKAVGSALFGPYLLAVELASMLLLGGLVAAYHLGRHEDQ
jgi:NADH-quinone oxidoreductase subunit J